MCVCTCGCVRLRDGRLLGGEARGGDGGARAQTAGVKTAQEQGETQHDHLHREGVGRGGVREGWDQGEAGRGQKEAERVNKLQIAQSHHTEPLMSY